MTKRPCIFCEIYKTEGEAFYENKHFFARFDKFPITPGHAEIIPINHTVSLQDLTEEQWESFPRALKDTIEIIKGTNLETIYENFLKNPLNENSAEFCKKMLSHVGIGRSFEDYNLGVNDGRLAGRTIDHLHFHVIPRYAGDVKDPAGGVRHIIPGLDKYKE